MLKCLICTPPEVVHSSEHAELEGNQDMEPREWVDRSS